jgi:hypothetical protein
MQIENSFKLWLSSLIGEKLVSVIGLFHIFNNQVNGLAQEIGFMFENVKFGKLFCDSDGETLCYSSKRIVVCDMKEYGRQETISMYDNFIFKNAIGKRLSSINLIYSCLSNKIIGTLFLFEHGISFCIMNLGDELFVYEDIPKHIFLEENLKTISIKK